MTHVQICYLKDNGRYYWRLHGPGEMFTFQPKLSFDTLEQCLESISEFKRNVAEAEPSQCYEKLDITKR
jgi:hypothetical protein